MKKIINEKFDKDTIYEYYITKNLSYDDVAAELGLTQSQVRRLCKKYNIKKNISEWKESAKKTNLKKYGCENPFGNEEIKKKIVETNNQKYGVDYAINNKEIREKANNTFMSNYGCKNYDYVGIDEQKLSLLSDDETVRETIIKNNLHNAQDICNFFGFKGIATAYRIIKKFSLQDMMDKYTSRYESEITNFLRNLGIRCFKTKDIIPPYELDVYCPDYNIAIEINGNLYHSFIDDGAPHCDGKDKYYHQRKSILCEKNGVFLFHIFEYELLDERKHDIVLSQLKNLFFKNDYKIYARQCEICYLSNEEKNLFLNENHRQGKDTSQIYIGLKHNNEIMSVMTFSKPRFTKKYDWELVRFCSKTGYNVVGAASKLFNFFVRTYKGNIISYSDIAKTRGSVYSKMGFAFSGYSEPSYVWCNSSNIIKTRYQCRMKNEKEYMLEQGFWRIYDCGTKVWIYTTKDR